MNNWFECKVKYDKIDENGKEKTVTEPYLVDALSFGEAEERIHKEMESFISGDFEVSGIKKEKFADVFPIEDADRWYKSTVCYIDIDEKSGKEKKTKYQILVMGNSTRNAEDNLNDQLKDIVIPWKLKGIIESPIIDIFPYKKAE